MTALASWSAAGASAQVQPVHQERYFATLNSEGFKVVLARLDRCAWNDAERCACQRDGLVETLSKPDDSTVVDWVNLSQEYEEAGKNKDVADLDAMDAIATETAVLLQIWCAGESSKAKVDS